MDAVKYINEKARMSHDCKISCGECPLSDFCCSKEQRNAEKMVAIVEKWSNEHPPKTRQSEFLKMFPKAKLDNNEILVICPILIDADFKCKMDEDHENCMNCARKFWLAEVE